MTERDERQPDQFLVDGVAPSVIGGAAGPDPLTEERREPPTAPIPAQGQARPPANQPAERKTWLGKMFGR